MEQLILIQKQVSPNNFAIAVQIIDRPVPTIRENQDRIINPQRATELKYLLKKTQVLIIYSGISHMPLLELAQTVAQEYLKFLIQLLSTQHPLYRYR